MFLFVNVPYRMVEKSLERATGLSIGLEIYLDNHLIEEIDTDEVKGLSKKLKERNIPCTVHAPFMDLSPGSYDPLVREITGRRFHQVMDAAALLRPGGLLVVGTPDSSSLLYRLAEALAVWSGGRLDYPLYRFFGRGVVTAMRGADGEVKGYSKARLYPGSMSDWTSDASLPVVN